MEFGLSGDEHFASMYAWLADDHAELARIHELLELL